MKVEEKLAGYNAITTLENNKKNVGWVNPQDVTHQTETVGDAGLTHPTITGNWPLILFERVAVSQSDRGKRIKQRDYLPEGHIPVVDQGQALIGGYTNDEDFAFSGELPVVLFGDHTRAVKLINHRFAVGADGIKIFRPAEGVSPKYLYYWMKSAPIPDRGYGRHYQYLRQMTVPLPPPNKRTYRLSRRY